MSSGKGGGTQRSFFGFSPKIVSSLLLSSSMGILIGRGLDPLLILHYFLYNTKHFCNNQQRTAYEQ
jgi:hypothetical protein